MNLLGKLSWDAIPHDPIVIGTLIVVAIGGGALFAIITKMQKWGWLWREWLTSVDHKRLGMEEITGIIKATVREYDQISRHYCIYKCIQARTPLRVAKGLNPLVIAVLHECIRHCSSHDQL